MKKLRAIFVKDEALAKEHYDRGIAKKKLGQYEAAIKDYDKAIRLKPDYAFVFNSRGNAKRELGQYEAAIKDYTEATRLKGDFALAFSGRGVAKRELGQYQEAIYDFNTAIFWNPDDSDHFVNRGLSKDSLGQYEEAIRDYDEAIRLSPYYAGAFCARGLSKLNLGQYEAAIEDFNEAAINFFWPAPGKKPDYAYAFNGLGLACLLQKNLSEAEKHYDRALQSAPTLQRAKQGKALIAFIQGQTEKANAIFQEIEQYYSNNAKNNMTDQLYLYEDKARVCLVWGLTALAQEAINKGLNLKADYVPLLQLQTQLTQKQATAPTAKPVNPDQPIVPTAPQKLSPQVDVHQKLQEGHMLRELEEHDKALACYDDVLKLDKLNIQAMLYKGTVYETKGELEKAQFYYQTILESHGDSNDKTTLALAQEKLEHLKAKQAEPEKQEGPLPAKPEAKAPENQSPSVESLLQRQTTGAPSIPYQQLQMGKLIGQGAYGAVYYATYQGFPVAVKTLTQQSISADALKKFENEIELMAKLSHAYIVKLYGASLEEMHCALVMEYMAGGSLYKLLSDFSKPLAWPTRISISWQITQGLNYLHAQKTIHGDIKSLNILLDEGMTAKITDFGLSFVKQTTVTSSHTKSMVKGGSTRWMAPELFSEESKLTFATDVYSYAWVLWEIASRQLPYAKAVNEYVIPNLILQGKRAEIPQDTPAQIKKVIKKCWQQAPEARPTIQTVVELFEGKTEMTISHAQEKTEAPEINSISGIQSEALPEGVKSIGNINSDFFKPAGNLVPSAQPKILTPKIPVSIIPQERTAENKPTILGVDSAGAAGINSDFFKPKPMGIKLPVALKGKVVAPKQFLQQKK